MYLFHCMLFHWLAVAYSSGHGATEQNMIHFLISHSISLYCQTERKRGGARNRQRHEREQEGQWWRGRHTERQKRLAENEIKRKKQKGFTVSQATRHSAMKSSAVGARPCKTHKVCSPSNTHSCITAPPPTHLTYFPQHSFNTNSYTTRQGFNLSWIDVRIHASSCT